jgi:hypothetical protein
LQFPFPVALPVLRKTAGLAIRIKYKREQATKEQYSNPHQDNFFMKIKNPGKARIIQSFCEQKFLQIESTFLLVMLIALAVPFGSRTR